MIEKVIIKDRVGYFHNSNIHDPLLEKIKWYSLSSESSNFRKYKLIEIDSERFKFISTFRGLFGSILFMLFATIIFGMGIFIGEYSLSDLFKFSNFNFESDLFLNVFLMLLGLLMIIVGFLMYYFDTIPRHFDKTKGLFWRGRKIPNEKKKKKIAVLQDIHALQIISKRTRTSRATSGTNFKYVSFELNLILHSGRRVHVVCHGHKESMTADALKLSGFLNKPIWDATK
jgi:hypothetical protein